MLISSPDIMNTALVLIGNSDKQALNIPSETPYEFQPSMVDIAAAISDAIFRCFRFGFSISMANPRFLW